MKKYLLVFSLLLSFIFNEALAQPATVGVPVSIGRDNCGTAGATLFANTNSTGGSVYSSCASNDSVYFFGYSAATLTKSTTLFSYLPRLRIGNSTYQGRFTIGGVTGLRNFRDRFTVSASSISYNPRDRRIYYIWTDYNLQVAPVLKSYIWSWPPDTTFSSGTLIPYNTPTATPPGVAAPAAFLMDTVRSFSFDIGGVTFDNVGTTWQLEFSNPPAPYKSMLRKLNFSTGFIDPVPDTLDLIPGAGGRGDTMYNVGSGDITLMPNGQMYYVFDNKLYTPDYGSYGGSTRHINSTYIDTVRRPGAVSLVGLAYSDGDLISSFSPGCVYRRIDPITGDTNFVNYTYPATKGVRSSDMTQITSGLGVAKRLVSATPTGTPKQYDVVYDVFVKNYGTTQITNIQVKDSLGGILGNGIPIGNGSVSNVSLSMQTIPPPPGIAINPAYNGTTNINLLQSTGQNLNNFPADSTSFIIRINCRLSNIDTGIVYNNSAVGFANGYKNVPLRDSSTNGNVPDLNQNDKPDDVGESVPTPLLIALAGTRDGCATLTATLYTENFGSGTGLSTTLPGSYITTYTGSTTEPIARNTYTITNNARNADTTNFVSMTDHTGGANGRMMVFNADAPPRVFFRDTMPTSCPGRQYSLTFWTAFPANSVYAASCAALGGFRYPKVRMRMIDIVTGLDVVNLTTDSFYSPGWVQKGMRWTMPRGYSNLIMELSNAAPGGCGNDMLLDDIVYGTCDALPTVNASSLSGCLGDSIRFVGSLADSTVLPGPKDHQWQVAPTAGGPWTDISGATLPYLTINPILPADTGRFYRLIVAAQGSIAIPICRSTSPGVKLTGTSPSTAPTNITAPSTTICSGSSVTLTAVGGTLGSGANYQWGTGSTVGTSPISGATSSTLTVSPTSTTTYWVRIENTSSPCSSSTGGRTLTVTVNQPSIAPSSITGANICNPGSTTLTAVGGTLGTSANYQWGTGSTVGTSPISGATSSTLTVSPTSTTTYWVRIENTSSPCTATTTGLTRVITVTQPSVAPTSITAPSTTICNGGSVTLTAAGGTLGTSANYQWGTGSTVGTSPIGGATSSTLTVSPTSTTTYWVRIENTASPCTAITGGTTVVVTVNQPSVAPTSITGANICAGSSTTLTALGGTLGTSANYQWGTGSTVGTSPISGATSSTLTVSPTSTTTYWVRIENTSSPCTATTTGLTRVITVSQLSVPPTSAGKNKNGSICPGISVKIFRTGGSLGTGATWRWYTGSPGGTLIGSGDTLTVTPVVNTKYYIRAEGSCNTTTADSVSINISCDIDKDDDGIPDFVENRIITAATISQAYNIAFAGYKDNNNDFINDDFQADGDSDNDGIANYLDLDFIGRVDSNGDNIDDRFDNDLDSIIDMLDLDSDNDGIPDVVEANGVDANGDGRIDNFTDTDGDGLSQNVDANNTGANNSNAGLGIINFDNDNVSNEFDADSDNDGIPDVIEAAGPDTNNDGIIDGFVDLNGDGLHDSYINASGLLLTGADVTSDGRADSYPNKNFDSDFRPNAYDIDSDGDGIIDVTEAGFTTTVSLEWVAGPYGTTDGWSTAINAMPILVLRNTDGRGNPDHLDIDSDDDGIPDQIEGQPTANPLPAPYNMPLGTDVDRDGLDTRYDNVPATFGGRGIIPLDLDGDGTPDYRDLDTDADGQLDIYEGNDFNLNGMADDNVTLTLLDADGDGLDNRFDSSFGVKGTSYNLANGGYTAGDPSPGARCPVQRRLPGNTDRDWRFAGSVLPVQILSFTGTQQNNNVLLNWSIITPQKIDHFEIERSVNNNNYGKVGQLNSVVQLNINQAFSYPDDITNVSSDIIYYRLKVVAKSGEVKYSNVLVVRKSNTKTTIAVMPNPAYDYLQIRLFSDKPADVNIRLIDASGKLVLNQKQQVQKGNNTLQLNELNKFAKGNYMLQLNISGNLTTHKIILM